jgi:hypothetical protein
MTQWTIWLSLACLFAATALGAGRDPAATRWRVHRVAWTAGCFFAWLHVAAAFHYFHGWSYAQAAEETSRRTAEVIGRTWGGEIWFNFAFVGLWGIDAAWRWLKPHWSDPLAAASAMIQLFLLFIAFNATVVFEDGGTRVAGIAGFAALTAIFAVQVLRRRSTRESEA